MAWPTDRTASINDLNAVVYRQILKLLVNLVSEGEQKEFRVAAARGAIETHEGADEWHVPVLIGGPADADIVEYDPADSDPTDALTTTGQKILADAKFKAWSRTQNVTFNQDFLNLGKGALAVMDHLATRYKAHIMLMLEGLLSASATRKGLWYTSSVLPSAGMTNLKTIYADRTSDFGEVDVSAYPEYLPQLVTTSAPSGANLVSDDLQALYNACERGLEGGITDWFTDTKVWEAIRKNIYTDGVLAVGRLDTNFGLQGSIPFADTWIHRTRHATKSTAWDVTNGATAYNPLVGVDFRNLAWRIIPGAGVQGDDVGVIRRVGDLATIPGEPKVYQRIALTAQWYLRQSRRTGGTIEGLDL